MKIEQLYTNCLAQGAYYIENEGEAALIDPMRDVQAYIDLATSRNATIKYVFETHFHADFVSGHVELAERTGATIVYGPTTMKIGFQACVAKDGQQFQLGKSVITLLHTPGHTMESVCYLLTDERGKEVSLFTGDTLFIGDVGRPDLAQKVIAELTQEKLANALYDSLWNKIMPLSDDLIIYPGHGKGSACGKMLSDKKQDTLGNQKKTNYALNPDLSKAEFVAQVLDGLMPPPGYFPHNVMQNIQGAKAIKEVLKTALHFITPLQFSKLAKQQGVVVIDTRKGEDFSEGFVPDAINIGLQGDFAVWVGTMLTNIGTKILLVSDKGTETEVITRLARIGFDQVLGFLDNGMKGWEQAGLPINFITNIDIRQLSEKKHSKNVLLDVRRESEFKTERVIESTNIPLDYVSPENINLPKQQTVYVYCAAGYRSMIFVSYLKRVGYDNLVNVRGGFNAIKTSGLFNLSMYSCQTTML